MGSPMTPVYSGEISAAALGMKVEIWDLDGKDIGHTGEKGELVITKPFFSMPTTFWGKDGEKKYRKAYFETFPGVWCHGDFIKRSPVTGGYEILGRSDGVLNPGGKHQSDSLISPADRFVQEFALELQSCMPCLIISWKSRTSSLWVRNEPMIKTSGCCYSSR
jgi:acetoacetyl-CoA synthetase